MTRPSELMAPSATRVVEGAAAEDLVLGGRYVLGTRLGEGGMGVVYRAHDRMLHRTVAVKIFRPGTTEAARTATETQLLAGLNHPSLVTLFDAHVGDRAPQYLVMEYVDGPTLGEKLKDGPLPARTVRSVARDIGDALHAVHEAGIVHRDVKPSNVLLRASTVPGEEYHAKLADFGIAHLVDSTRQTNPGMVIGSAAYLSPEQVTGAPPAFAADIYSLGLLLLESLTGQRAFAQSTASEAALVRLTQDPVVPASLGPDWSALLTEMTARDPGRRPTAVDVVAAVTEIDPDAPIASAVIAADAATQPFEGIAAAAVTPTVAHPNPIRTAETAGIPALAVGPASDAAPDAPATDPLVHVVRPPAPDRRRDLPRRRRRRWMIAAGTAVVLFIAAMTLTVGMLGRGVGGQAVPAPAATHAATPPTTAPTPAPTVAAHTVRTPAPAPRTERAAAGTGNGTGSGVSNGSNTNSGGKGANSGKDGNGNGNGKGKGNGG